MELSINKNLCAMLLCLTGLPALAAPLGVAADYNVFVLGNITQYNTDIEGRLAAGGSAQLTNFGIGSSLSANPARVDLVVGGNLTYTNGQIFAGSGTYAGTASLSGVGTPNGTLTSGAPVVDFTAAAAALIAESDAYAALGGTVASPSYGSLTLSGADALLNVFYIPTGVLATLNSLSISAPSGSTVLINVAGTSNSFSNAGMSVSGTSQDKVIFNFFETQNLSLSSIGVNGSILAPEADLQFNNGQINGNVVAASLTGSGESHNALFTGFVPVSDVPEPATWAGVGAGLVALGLFRRHRAAR